MLIKHNILINNQFIKKQHIDINIIPYIYFRNSPTKILDMKKAKTFLFKKYSSIIGILVSILGFASACDGDDDGDSLSAEYGTPYATFKVKGNVSSEATTEAISNVKVIMGTDTTYTDELGNYEVSDSEFPGDQYFLVEFEDVNTEAEVTYQPLDTIVEFIDPEFSGGSDWYEGETAKEINITLKNEE